MNSRRHTNAWLNKGIKHGIDGREPYGMTYFRGSGNELIETKISKHYHDVYMQGYALGREAGQVGDGWVVQAEPGAEFAYRVFAMNDLHLLGIITKDPEKHFFTAYSSIHGLKPGMQPGHSHWVICDELITHLIDYEKQHNLRNQQIHAEVERRLREEHAERIASFAAVPVKQIPGRFLADVLVWTVEANKQGEPFSERITALQQRITELLRCSPGFNRPER